MFHIMVLDSFFGVDISKGRRMYLIVRFYFNLGTQGYGRKNCGVLKKIIGFVN